MLKHRVIPMVLIDGFSVLKTVNFSHRRNLGSPVTVARTYNTRNVDELILLDIDASKQNRAIDKFTIMDIASELFMPLTVGGGIKTTKDIEMALKMGADKVAINSGVLCNPIIIREFSQEFGQQCITVSIDVKKEGSEYKIYSHTHAQVVDINIFDFCKEVEQLGAGELLINNVTQDGLMTGPDLVLISLITSLVSIPVIAAGGISVPSDFTNVVEAGALAVAAASIFHFTRYTPDECKASMKESGISVRI
jgi:cyclase